MKFISSLFLALMLFSPCISQGDGATLLFLVRHAEKVDDARDPDLSEAGRLRAVRLMSVLEEESIERLYSTPYKRTQQTLQPLAETLNLEIRLYDPKDTAAIDRMISDCRNKTAVIAGHSNSIPRLANRLIGEDIYADLDESIYNRLWILRISGDGVTEHRVVEY